MQNFYDTDYLGWWKEELQLNSNQWYSNQLI
ncbi:hypothetical protein SAMN05443144_12534 [Fodinibius roseus]|uniref:Uncharacterized protein n=1 Tax=Fodinibius roseus TaxID=1194090 RepID=A0A1M5J144_9BACT|nr:hypothetical protein SAMN05443144_12534 [Fodinibius roseus]